MSKSLGCRSLHRLWKRARQSNHGVSVCWLSFHVSSIVQGTRSHRGVLPPPDANLGSMQGARMGRLGDHQAGFDGIALGRICAAGMPRLDLAWKVVVQQCGHAREPQLEEEIELRTPGGRSMSKSVSITSQD